MSLPTKAQRICDQTNENQINPENDILING